MASRVGNDTHGEGIDEMEQHPNLVEGMYGFDPSTAQWKLCPHVPLKFDDPTVPSTDDVCIPEQCQMITWNILFDYFYSESIHTALRYPEVFKTLKSFLPDIICLQEVTRAFLDLLLNEAWIRENNYSVIIMGSIVDRRSTQTYGQLILTKNFRARAFSVCSLPSGEHSSNRRTPYTKEYIIARFGLNSNVTIDLVNLHLPSDYASNAIEQRCRALEHFFKTMNTHNYMLIGDFNFGEEYPKEQYLLRKYEHQIHDLWTDVYDSEEEPGFTYDPERNSCAKITSARQQRLRLDRYLLHLSPSLSYSIEDLNLIGREAIPTNPAGSEYIHQSDHYGVRLLINLRVRSISRRSALVLFPSIDVQSGAEVLHERSGSSVNQQPPYVDLLWPFFDLTDAEDDEENILLPLRLLLAQCDSFDVETDGIEPSTKNGTLCLQLNPTSRKYVQQLRTQIQQLFPQCILTGQKNDDPKMILARVDDEAKLNQIQSTSMTGALSFPVRYACILQRFDEASFHVAYQLPIGPIVEPLRCNRQYGIDGELQNFFHRMDLYESEQSYEAKHDKFHRLSVCLAEIFNPRTLHYYTYAFLSYGSFRLGLNGEDLDTVLVLSENKTTTNPTELDRTISRLRYDVPELTNLIFDLLEKQMHHAFNDEIAGCRRIQALYPILSISFTDQTRVELFVQIKEVSLPHGTPVLSNFHEPIHGVHDIERLITYVRHPPVFQYLLTFIRTWAKHVGLYGQVYGYLGGYSWAVLCACICRQFTSTSDPVFSLDQLFLLVRKFFSVYSQFDWSHQSLHLYTKLIHHDPMLVDYHGAMRILCPSPPFGNSARSTTNSTRQMIIQGFQRAAQITERTGPCEDNLGEILYLSDQFPDQTIQSIIQLTVSSQNIVELHQWLGYVKSRLAHFLTDCEDECHLFVQTDAKVEQRGAELERFYSMGFQIDAHTLSRHRQFYYAFNKFLDEIRVCPFRSETMKISYKLTSIHDWRIERTR